MCGILATNSHSEKFTQALGALEHRGPDFQTVQSLERAQIGFTRLAIRGLGPEGQQPFQCPCGRWTVIYNGEIYNWKDLSSDFDLKEESTCDGRVIAPLLCKLGSHGFSRLKGMFAIIAYDNVNQKFFVVRDQLGLKPLYITHTEKYWAISSEIKPLLILGSDSFSVDALNHYKTFGFLSPNQSGFMNITLVEPGKVLVLNSEELIGAEYLQKTFVATKARGTKDLKKELSRIVIENSETDVRTAIAFSSGFDSNLIANILMKSEQNFELFHLTGITEHDETHHVVNLARKMEIPLTIETISSEEISLEDYFARMDRLTFDGLNSYLFSKKMSENGIKTFLSGHGGDEFLRGYKHSQFGHGIIQEIIGRSPTSLRSKVLKNTRYEGRAHLYTNIEKTVGGRFPRYYGQSRSFGLSPTLESYSQIRIPHACLSLMDTLRLSQQDAGQIFHYLSGLSLLDLDQFSMSFSIEGRPPLVDLEILALFQNFNIRTKRDLANAIDDKTLQQILNRSKKGFSINISSLLESNLDYTLEKIHILQDIPRFNISNAQINAIVSNRRSLRTGSSNLLWQLLTLASWIDKSA